LLLDFTLTIRKYHTNQNILYLFSHWDQQKCQNLRIKMQKLFLKNGKEKRKK